MCLFPVGINTIDTSAVLNCFKIISLWFQINRLAIIRIIKNNLITVIIRWFRFFSGIFKRLLGQWNALRRVESKTLMLNKWVISPKNIRKMDDTKLCLRNADIFLCNYIFWILFMLFSSALFLYLCWYSSCK